MYLNWAPAKSRVKVFGLRNLVGTKLLSIQLAMEQISQVTDAVACQFGKVPNAHTISD